MVMEEFGEEEKRFLSAHVGGFTTGVEEVVDENHKRP